MLKDLTDKNMTTFGTNLNQLGTVCKIFSKGFSIILISSVIEFSTSAFDYMVIMNKI